MTNKYVRVALLMNGAIAVLFNTSMAYAQTTALPLVVPASATSSPSTPAPASVPAKTSGALDVMIIPAASSATAPQTGQTAPPSNIAAVVPATLELPVGSIIEMTPVSIVSTKKLKVGDTVELTVLNDVAQGGEIFVPKGAKGFAVVDEAVGGRIFGKGGQMTMSFQKLQLPSGLVIALSGQHAETGARGNTGLAQQVGQSGASLAGLGGSLGAVSALAGLFAAAALKGSAAKIKPGAVLKARTSSLLTIGTDGIVSLGKIAQAIGNTPPAVISLPSTSLSSTIAPASAAPVVAPPTASK